MADYVYDPFEPGWHSFTGQRSKLLLEYIVFSPNGVSFAEARRNFIMVQCPGWGIASYYLQTGLSDLWQPANWHPETPRYTVIFFQPRGTDQSGRPLSLYGLGMSTMDMARDIEDLRHLLGVEYFPVMLGHGNGGAMAINYAQEFPDRVHKLILIAHQIIGMQDRQTDKLAATKDNPAYRGAWDKVTARVPVTDEELTNMVNAFWPLYFYDPARYTGVLLRDVGDTWMSVVTYRMQAHCDQQTDRGQMIDGLKYVRAKTLVMCGEDDWMIGPEIPRRTVMEIPDAKLITYKECGHFPWIENKEDTMTDIRRFIEGDMT